MTEEPSSAASARTRPSGPIEPVEAAPRRIPLIPVIVAVGATALLLVAVLAPRDNPDAATGSRSQGPVRADASASSTPDPEPTSTPYEIDPPPDLGPRLDLVEVDGWLNTDIESLDRLDGQVVMVEFWTFGCHNCKARIPYSQELYAKYRDQGFEIVGVHSPEFSYEAEPDAVAEAVERLGVTWPVALDPDKTNFRSWQTGGRRFWPRTFLIDREGQVRYDHIGEGDYENLDATIGWLLSQ